MHNPIVFPGGQDVIKFSLPQNPKEGYSCAACNSVCVVYLPEDCFQNLSVNTLDSIHNPQLCANEILLTPLVCISPHGLAFSADKPAIIELIRTVELTNQHCNPTLVPLFNNSMPPEWKDLEFSSGCEMLDDRVVFKTTHFSYFTVVARFPLPSATVSIEPDSSPQSQPAELTVPELPGFKVEIPSSSVEITTDITATVYYDDPELYVENDQHSLATSCIALEPHNMQFTQRIPITMPIPNYAEIVKEHPDIKLQLWCSSGSSENVQANWEQIEDSDVEIICDGAGNYLATAYTTHFTFFTFLYNKSVDCCMNFFAERIRGRCQVFMTRETKLGSFLNFGISVLLYPFQDQYRALQNYEYLLYDSMKPIEVIAGKLECKIEFNESLLTEMCSSQRCYSQSCRFSKDLTSQADFLINLDASGGSELPAGVVLANLVIEHGYEAHKFNLIKVHVANVTIP